MWKRQQSCCWATNPSHCPLLFFISTLSLFRSLYHFWKFFFFLNTQTASQKNKTVKKRKHCVGWREVWGLCFFFCIILQGSDTINSCMKAWPDDSVVQGQRGSSSRQTKTHPFITMDYMTKSCFLFLIFTVQHWERWWKQSLIRSVWERWYV